MFLNFKKLHFLLPFFLFLTFFLSPLTLLSAPASDDPVVQPEAGATILDSEPDAIAIRIIPNLENYNIQQWYPICYFDNFTGNKNVLADYDCAGGICPAQ
ncbi:MAG: hypothetical protein WC164_00015 [Patescibacteria group bacterium]|nr:hypothetical protein [Patescibacteria group bacterium]